MDQQPPAPSARSQRPRPHPPNTRRLSNLVNSRWDSRPPEPSQTPTRTPSSLSTSPQAPSMGSGFAGGGFKLKFKRRKVPTASCGFEPRSWHRPPHPNSPEGGWLRGPLLRRKASWLKATSFSAEGGGQWGNLIYLTSTGRFWQILVDINPGISKTRLLNSAS